jgi:hypothetical protein
MTLGILGSKSDEEYESTDKARLCNPAKPTPKEHMTIL